MNWLHKLKFRYKISQTNISTVNLSEHMSNAVILQNPGEWTISDCTEMKPSYKLQRYVVCRLLGKNVIQQSDEFFVKLFGYIKKASNIIHPYDGFHSQEKDWSESVKQSPKTPEEIEERWKILKDKQPEKAEIYNSEYGHKLMYFRAYIKGKKSKFDEMETLGNSDIIFDTPYDLGIHVKEVINKFYFGGDEGDEDDIAPIPSPKINNFQPVAV